MPTVTRLTSNGVFQTIGGLGSFDEISLDSGSIFLNGSISTYLTTSDNSAFAFGTNDFTVEYLIYSLSFSTAGTVFDTRLTSSSTNGYADYFNTNGTFALFINNTTIFTSPNSVPINAWTHIAVTRSGTSLKVFINGVQSGSTITNSTNMTDTKCLVGININLANAFNGYISNLRVVKGTALYTADFTPPTAPLTPVANTSLLLTASPQNPYLDSSNNNFTITRNGTPRFNSIGPFYYPGNTSINLANTNNNPVLGSNTNIITSTTSNGVVMVSGEFDEVSMTSQSLLFNGTTGYLSLPTNSAFTFGTGDFTIECWFNASTYKSFGVIFSTTASYITSDNIYLQTDAVGSKFAVSSAGTLLITAPNTFNLNTWYHIAVVRNATTMTLYVNGISQGSVSNSQSFTSDTPVIGSINTTSFPVNGYVSNIRILKGTALYTANSTPPQMALSPIANTSLLLNNFEAQPFVDNSSNNNTITVNGGVTANTLTPFANIQRKILNTGTMMVKEYDEVSMTPGSLRFDGSTGYLSVPYSSNFEFGSGDFTIEFWMYSSGISNQGFMSFPHNAANYGQVLFYAGATLQLYSSSDGINWDVANASSLGSINLNAWNHIAVSKSGSSIRTFKNGVLMATITFAGTFAGTYDRCWIGDTAQNPHYNGLFSNIRVVKGTALYTANFTPPTTALTAIANTVLLLNTTTAQPFVDSSSNNLTITVNGSVTSNTFTPF